MNTVAVDMQADATEKRNQIWAFVVTGMLILISMLYYNANPYYIYLVV